VYQTGEETNAIGLQRSDGARHIRLGAAKGKIGLLHIDGRGTTGQHDTIAAAAEPARRFHRNRATQRPAVEHDGGQAELIHQGDDVTGDGIDAHIGEILVRGTTAPVVQHDNAMPRRQQRWQGVIPRTAAETPAVDQQYSAAANPVILEVHILATIGLQIGHEITLYY
jgi:hypothetical protein